MLAEALYGQADQNTYLQVELLSVTVQHNIINYMPILKPQHLNSDTTSQIFTSGLLTFVNVDVVTLHGDPINPCVFSDNKGPVFTGIATDFQLEGNLLFENNQAITGIVFLLFSFSHMFLKPGLIALFMNNSNYNNREYGSIIKNGASYDNTMCVFQVMTDDISAIAINVTFIADNGNNTVPIYAASLYNCRQATLPIEPRHLRELYQQIFHFYGYFNNKTMLSTADHINFCYKHSNDAVINVTTYPGAVFYLHIVIEDDKDSRVPSNLLILHSDKNPNSWTLGNEYNIDNNKVNDDCQNYTFTLKGEPGNGSFFITLPYTRPTLTFNIKLLECPFGFSFSKNQTCECNKFINYLVAHNRTLKCVFERAHPDCPYIEIPFGSWIGLVNVNGFKKIGFAPICPRDLCNLKRRFYDVHDISKCPHSSSYKITCTKGRTGEFCSECMRNHSVIFGSSECRECSNLWLFTLPGFVVAAFILVVIVYLMRLTLDNGAIGGIILYANFAEVCTRFHKFYSPGSTTFATLFISLINLTAGLPLCFYNGMTDVVKHLFKFFFPVLLWLVVIAIVMTSRYSTRFSNFAKRSPQLLITVMHLSFARVLMTTINAFSIGQVYIDAQDTYNGPKPIYIWFLNGKVPYGSYPHALLLAAATVASLLFLLPYFILVVFGTCLLRFKTIDKLRPFYDTIYAPYKDSFRWWFGARQFVLVVEYVIFAALAGTHISNLLLASYCLISIFALAQAWISPFKSALINFIDTSYLVNLAILVFIGLYYTAHSHKPPALLLYLIFGIVPFTFFMNVIVQLLISLGVYDKLKACYLVHVQQSYICLWFRKLSNQAVLQRQAQYNEIPDDNSAENCELRESLLDM